MVATGIGWRVFEWVAEIVDLIPPHPLAVYLSNSQYALAH